MHRFSRLPRGRRKRGTIRLAVSLALIMIATFGTTELAAADMPTPHCTQSEQTGSGDIEHVMLVDCQPGFASDHDQIRIYPRGESVPGGTFDGLNASNAIWVFDANAQGRASLIVDFHRDRGDLVADLYDDGDGDHQVSYRLDNGTPVITERPVLVPRFERGPLVAGISEQLLYVPIPADAPRGDPTWTVQLRSLEGRWIHDDGTPVMNLDVLVNGPVLAMFAAETYLDRLFTDGRTDFVINVRNPSRDGRPDYDIRNAYPEVPDDWGIYRSELMVNEAHDEPPIKNFVFWPLLGSAGPPLRDLAGGTLPTVQFYDHKGQNYGIVKGYGESFAPIQVDWSGAKIIYVGEFVASRGNDHNWFTYSIKRIEPGKLTEPDFESPFAFYNLSGNHPGIPDLQVRAERVVPDDRYALSQWQGRAYQQIRYSWEQKAGQGWSYKLGLLGQHPIDGEVQLPGFKLRTIPYADFPTWVTTRAWDVASFVAVERPDYRSTEGIYEWGTTGTVRDEYYAGVGTDTGDFAKEMTSGLRGEYTLHLGTQPWLYFSPIDARLHLAGVSRGTYNIDGIRRVEYQSLAGDGHIDSWQRYDGDQLVAQLAQIPGALLYAGDGQVTLLKTDIPKEVLRTLPPTNHDEWVKLGEQLDANKRTFAADDLHAMLDQFHGDHLTLTGGSVSEFRLTDSGFRFVLDLQTGFNPGKFPVNGITGPGRYILEFNRATSQFAAQPSSPPAPAIDSIKAETSASALIPVDLSIVLANTGLEDVTTVPLIVTAARPGERPRLVANQTVDLLGSEHPAVRMSWTPPASGAWTISAHLYPPGGRVVERASDVHVAAAPEPPWRAVVTGGWPTSWPLAYVGALLGLIGLASAGGLLLVRRTL